MSDAEYEASVEKSTLAATPIEETALATVPHEQIIRPVTTAAQAKVDAVAHLTMSAYERAATLEITEEESAALLADFPDEAFKPGAAGKENLIYIEHAFLRDRFTQVFGMGKWAIIPRNRWADSFMTKAWPNKPATEGSRVYVEAMLIVRGCFVGEAVGAMEYYPSNAAQNYGDAVEGAKTAAFRRCAKEFGVGLQAWKKDWCAGWWERQRNGGRQQPTAAAPASPAPAPAAPPPTPKVKKPLTMATANTRAACLTRLEATEEGPARAALQGYLVALGWLDKDKVVEQWPYRFVPLSVEELEALKVGMGSFTLTGQAVRPYQPHGLDPATLQSTPQQAPLAAPASAAPPPIELPSPELPEPTGPTWRDYTFTFGAKTKGKTLGSLPDGELQYYIDNFTVTEFALDSKGVKQIYAPAVVAAARELRAALDKAAAEFAAKQPTTKG